MQGEYASDMHLTLPGKEIVAGRLKTSNKSMQTSVVGCKISAKG